MKHYSLAIYWQVFSMFIGAIFYRVQTTNISKENVIGKLWVLSGIKEMIYSN
jgi:hypothetical protein